MLFKEGKKKLDLNRHVQLPHASMYSHTCLYSHTHYQTWYSLPYSSSPTELKSVQLCAAHFYVKHREAIILTVLGEVEAAGTKLTRVNYLQWIVNANYIPRARDELTNPRKSCDDRNFRFPINYQLSVHWDDEKYPGGVVFHFYFGRKQPACFHINICHPWPSHTIHTQPLKQIIFILLEGWYQDNPC